MWHTLTLSDPVGHGYGFLDMLLVQRGKEVNGIDMSTSEAPTHFPHVFINFTGHMAFCNLSDVIFFKHLIPDTCESRDCIMFHHIHV